MKKAILITAFGSSKEPAMKYYIQFMNQLQAANQAACVYMAFSSERLAKKMQVEHVTDALERLYAEGVETLAVIPLYMMEGKEYQKVKQLVGQWSCHFKKISLGTPLLAGDTSIKRLADILMNDLEPKRDSFVILYMGHGTKDGDNSVYETLRKHFLDAGREDVYIKILEGDETDLTQFIQECRKKQIHTVELRTLMITCGIHTLRDLMGKGDSWAGQLKKAGLKVILNPVPLLEYESLFQ